MVDAPPRDLPEGRLSEVHAQVCGKAHSPLVLGCCFAGAYLESMPSIIFIPFFQFLSLPLDEA